MEGKTLIVAENAMGQKEVLSGRTPLRHHRRNQRCARRKAPKKTGRRGALFCLSPPTRTGALVGSDPGKAVHRFHDLQRLIGALGLVGLDRRQIALVAAAALHTVNMVGVAGFGF